MIICPKCSHDFSELDGLCHKCRGNKFVDVPKQKNKPELGNKQIICPRCNGAGTEQANKNRNNRQRGASNEYKAVDTFKDYWIGPNQSKYEWKKTPQSGGMALAAAFDMAGDICTTAPDFPFHVECKRTKGWDFGQLLLKAHEGDYVYGEMKSFIEQIIEDVPKEDNGRWKKVPLLWLMHPGPSQPTYVMLVHPIWSGKHLTSEHSMFHGTIAGQYDVYYHIMSLKTFLATTPDTWRIVAPKMVNSPQG